jgi:hypothetical protein
MTEAMLRAIEPSVTRPWRRRSSGTNAMPALIEACGSRIGIASPFRWTLPES